MTPEDVDAAIYHLDQAAKTLLEAWLEPDLKNEVESNRDLIISTIARLGEPLLKEEHDQFRRVILFRQLLKSAKMATGIVP